MGYTKDQDWHEFKIYIPDGVPEKHLRIGEIVKKKYGLKVMKFKNAKSIMPYAQKVFPDIERVVRAVIRLRTSDSKADRLLHQYVHSDASLRPGDAYRP